MIQTSEEQILKKIINSFQSKKGKLSFYCFNKNFIPKIVYNIIVPFNKKYPNEQIFIVVDGYNTRLNILNYIKNVTNENFNIRILSKDFIKTEYKYNYKLIFIIGINNTFPIIEFLSDQSKFTLCILTKNIMDNDFISKIHNILSFIQINDDINNIDNRNRIYSPVEEYRVGVTINDDDRETYNKYTEYINTTLSILNNISNIEKCKKGDEKLNISSSEFRYNLAKENGWNENLDTNIPFMKQIDDIYNPNSIYERACKFYTITKNRRDLLTDNEAKLETIKDICIKNKDKKIIIVSKRAEYAAKITKYLNKDLDLQCGDYHDCIEDTIAIDEMGIPILVKSGSNKGKQKMLGWRALSSLNEKRFNLGYINVLSIKNASDPKLKIACDILIFTSPICDDIISFKQRFINITFKNEITIMYKLYCINTVEADKMIRDKISPNVKIINEKENLITYDKNSGDIIL